MAVSVPPEQRYSRTRIFSEAFAAAVIREVREETGLEIRNPALTGVYHWSKAGIHNVVFLYKATEFQGSLTDSEEGKVYWIRKEDFLHKDLAAGMEDVWKIMHSQDVTECAAQITEKGCTGIFY